LAADALSGTVIFAGSPCAQNADVSGTFDGDKLAATVTASGLTASLDATVDATAMSGTFQVQTGGACSGSTGTFTANQ
jgi:hypothetical protein